MSTGNISEAESISFSSLGSDLQQKQDPKGERDYSLFLWAETAGAEIPVLLQGIQSRADIALVCKKQGAEGFPERTALVFTVFCCTVIIL